MIGTMTPAEQLIGRARRKMLELDEEKAITADDEQRWTFATQAEVDDLLRERLTFSGDKVQLIQPEGQDLKVYGLRVEIVDPRPGR